MKLLFTIGLLAALTQQNPAGPALGSVEGIVVKLANGEAVPEAGVELRRADTATLPAFITATTEDGKFILKDIPPGNYRLAATHAGFVRSEYGQRGLNGTGLTIAIEPGQHVKDAKIALIETGAISGRVSDSKGAPMPNVQVQALKYVYANGRRVLTTARAMVTNDLGEYRLFWLPPCDYVVMAKPLLGAVSDMLMTPLGDGVGMRPIQSATGAPILPPDETASVPVFFTGAMDLQSATPIHLKPGDDTTGIDIGMRAESPRKVRGIVTNLPANLPPGIESGGPNSSSLRISLTPRNATGFDDQSKPLGPGSTIDRATGAFEIPGVVPGSYYLGASVSVGSAGNTFYGRVPIDVRGDDVDNVTVPLAPGIGIQVRTSIDGRPSDIAAPELARLRIRLDSGAVAQPAAQQRADALEFRNVRPGDYNVLVEQLPETGYVKSIRMGDTNIQTDGLHVDRPLEDPIQIVIGLNGGALTGTAVTDAAKPSVNATVVLVPNPSARQRSDLYKTASTNASGEFKFAGIAPGDYKVFAWEDVETGAWQDPDFIKVYEDRGKPIHVGEGSAQVATVPAITMVRP